MMDVVPFMLLAAVVIVVVAARGYRRAVEADVRPGDEWAPAPEAEAMFLDCLAAKGVAIPDLRVYRDSSGLVLVGPDELDPVTRQALSDCDAEVVAALGEAAGPE